MISKECFTSMWIEDISAKLEYNDKNLIDLELISNNT